MEPFIAQIILFGGNFAPRGWAFCDGQLLSISQNQSLFSILGTTYGGDGRTSFGLPDLRGRTAIGPRNGPGLSSYREGQKGGVQDVTLNITQMPSHNHIATSVSTLGGQSAPGDDDALGAGVSIASGSSSGSEIFSESTPNTVMNAGSVATTTTVLNQGGNLAHTNMQPFLASNYIIALLGVYPSRS